MFRTILALLAFFTGAVPLLHAEQAASGDAPRVNIVFIFVDDQGYYDLGCYGATEIDTPRIDALAAGGVRFTDYYAAAPICSPSRAGLLTGCYPRRVGLATWVQRADSPLGIHPSEPTLAELLKANGYATACIGKWHLGYHEPFLPRQQGFDHYFGLLHNLDPVEARHFADQGGVPLLRNGKVVKRPADPAELTRLYTDEAIAFIRAHAEPTGASRSSSTCRTPCSTTRSGSAKHSWAAPGGAHTETPSRNSIITSAGSSTPSRNSASMMRPSSSTLPTTVADRDAMRSNRSGAGSSPLGRAVYHGSQGALAAVRWDQWKLHLNPQLTLYNLETDPGETTPVRNGEITRKLRGMAVLFQEEMSRDARQAGRVSER